MQPLILASVSPQRQTLLANIGCACVVEPSQVDESTCQESDPVQRAVVLARQKAQRVHERFPERFVLGGDTLVETEDGVVLEKPTTPEEAKAMVQQHSGSVSTVHSALCLCTPTGELYEGISSSKVYFCNLSEEMLDWWIGTDLWRDRSGGFQIDGPGQLMIRHLEGDWTGVVGLPVFLFGQLCEEAGYNWREA